MIERTIVRTKFERFYKGGGRFARKVAKKAALLRKENTVLGKPENVERLVQLAFYQPIFYCDNSTSMGVNNRFEIQGNLVRRMVEIATKVAPDGHSVGIHFINDESGQAHVVSSKQDLSNAFENTDLHHGSKLGTMLRSGILKPLVYNKIRSGKLARPLLVCIITDGHPTDNPTSTFRDKIAECKKKLKAYNYAPGSVMFCVSQIGDDVKATEFLEDLEKADKIRDVLHCTTDRLDDKYRELKENHDKLDEWLLEMLTKPIMMQQDSESE